MGRGDTAVTFLKRLRRRGNMGDTIFAVVAFVFGISILAIMAGVVFQLWLQSGPAREKFGWAFLWTNAWDVQQNIYGAGAFIYGTLVTAFIAMILAGPVGLGIAAFLVEITPRRVDRVLGSLVELLAAIPSIVYGLWGFYALNGFLREFIAPPLSAVFGWLPLFSGDFVGTSVLTASVVLAIMVLPTVAAVSRDVLRAVPDAQREAMTALGATRWEMFSRAVLPYAKNGVLGAGILGLGRAAGETMAVTFIIGNNPQIFRSLFEQGATIASQIASKWSEATEDSLPVLLELGLVLFAITIVINVTARLMVSVLSGGPRGGVRA
jgi:phosphate transport system permease protein